MYGFHPNGCLGCKNSGTDLTYKCYDFDECGNCKNFVLNDSESCSNCVNAIVKTINNEDTYTCSLNNHFIYNAYKMGGSDKCDCYECKYNKKMFEPFVYPKKTIIPESTFGEVTIVDINDECIEFSNGKCICFDHIQDCCEHNFADFEQLDDIARNYKFTLPIRFEKSGDHGFRFGDNKSMFYIPCYSDQNGYYSNKVDIFYGPKSIMELQLAWFEGCEKDKYKVLSISGDENTYY